MANTFTAQLRNFTDKTEAKMRRVAFEAIQDVVEGAQTPQTGITRGATSFEEGKIPIGTTEKLINSLTASINGSKVGEGRFSYTTALTGFQIGDTMTFAWTMEYAARIEFGFNGTDALGREYNQAGRHFVGHNAAQFQDFVDRAVREVSRD